MRLIAHSTLAEFYGKHPETKAALTSWEALVKASDWKMMSDVQASFSKAKVLNGDRARFEIAGGDYRLIASFNFQRGIVGVKFIGTHADYDRVDALTVSQF